MNKVLKLTFLSIAILALSQVIAKNKDDIKKDKPVPQVLPSKYDEGQPCTCSIERGPNAKQYPGTIKKPRFISSGPFGAICSCPNMPSSSGRPIYTNI